MLTFSKVKEFIQNVRDRSHKGILKIAKSEKMRLVGIVIGGTSCAEAFHYCFSLLGGAEWLIITNYSLSAMTFIIGGIAGYTSVDLSRKGLSRVKTDLATLWQHFFKTDKNQGLLQQNQQALLNLIEAQKTANDITLALFEDFSLIANSPLILQKIGQLSQQQDVIESMLNKLKGQPIFSISPLPPLLSLNSPSMSRSRLGVRLPSFSSTSAMIEMMPLSLGRQRSSSSLLAVDESVLPSNEIKSESPSPTSLSLQNSELPELPTLR